MVDDLLAGDDLVRKLVELGQTPCPVGLVHGEDAKLAKDLVVYSAHRSVVDERTEALAEHSAEASYDLFDHDHLVSPWHRHGGQADLATGFGASHLKVSEAVAVGLALVVEIAVSGLLLGAARVRHLGLDVRVIDLSTH